jgi:hypothetical protein
LTNPHVQKWFAQNVDIYLKSHKNNPKVSPFPYGIREGEGTTTEVYRNSFLRNLQTNKTEMVYAGYLAQRSDRSEMPSGEKLPIPLYLQALAHSLYILSPNGDRPECYRHYEAIGLGTVPITQLDPFVHGHLQGAVIYKNNNWNITKLGQLLPRSVTVDRNMIFEEYWMEYVERTANVGPLQWWDRNQERRAPLVDFVVGTRP